MHLVPLPLTSPASDEPTPPLSSSLDSLYFSDSGSESSLSPLSANSSTDSLGYFYSASFLDAVFPNAAPAAVPIQSDLFRLAVADKTVYAKGFTGHDVCLRENLVDLIDRADLELECERLVVVIEKSDPDLAQLLHSLLYVGGVVLSPAVSSHASQFVLVAIDI